MMPMWSILIVSSRCERESLSKSSVRYPVNRLFDNHGIYSGTISVRDDAEGVVVTLARMTKSRDLPISMAGAGCSVSKRVAKRGCIKRQSVDSTQVKELCVTLYTNEVAMDLLFVPALFAANQCWSVILTGVFFALRFSLGQRF